MDDWSQDAISYALIGGVMGWLLLDSIIWATIIGFAIGYYWHDHEQKKRNNGE